MSGLLAGRFGRSARLESDWFWTILVDGIPPWRPEADPQNHVVVRSFGAAAAVLAAGGLPVVLDGVVGPWMLPEVVGECRRLDVAVHYVVLRPDLGTCLGRARIRTDDPVRIAGNPPLVDEESIRQLWHAFADLGELEGHVVDTTAMTTSDAAAQVWERFEAGELHL